MHHRRSVIAAMWLAAHYAVVAYAPLVRPVAAQEAGAPRACPATGRVERSVGGPVEYLGAVPGIPELCRMRRGDAPEQAFYLAVYASEWPGAGLAYPVIRGVLHGAKGMTGEFITQAGPGFEWRDIYVNEGQEDVALPGGRTVRAVRLAHERIGINGNTYRSVVTQWKELTTGMIVHQEYRPVAGRAAQGAAWLATEVSGLP